MALVDEVKRELAAFEGDTSQAVKAQASAMLRFAGKFVTPPQYTGLGFEASFDSLEAAEWLQRTLADVFNHESELKTLSRPAPGGTIKQHVVFIPRNVPAIALKTGLLDARKSLVKGLPQNIINGSIAQVKAAWRGAFLARGLLSEPGKACFLEIVCPTEEAAMALVGAARRLGIQAKHRNLRTSERVTLKDPDAIERMLKIMGATNAVREWTGKRDDSPNKIVRLANFDDANMRRSAKAAAEASEKIRHAFEVLGNDIPDNLRQAGELRVKYVDKTLEELGKLAEPQVTKDAIAGRIRRLLQLAFKREHENDEVPLRYQNQEPPVDLYRRLGMSEEQIQQALRQISERKAREAQQAQQAMQAVQDDHDNPAE